MPHTPTAKRKRQRRNLNHEPSTPINRAIADTPKADALPPPIDPADLSTDLQHAREIGFALHYAEQGRRRLLAAVAEDRTPTDDWLMVPWRDGDRGRVLRVDLYAAFIESRHLMALAWPELPWEQMFPQPEDEPDDDGPETYPVDYAISEGLTVIRQRRRKPQDARPKATQPGCPGTAGTPCSGLRRPGEKYCVPCARLVRAWAREGGQ